MRYLDFIRLIGGARLVLTDSGGVQEETTILGVPCLTLRENTERPVTIEQGTNRLAGTDPEQILDAAFSALEGGRPQVRPPELWDGMASRRIFHVLANIFSGSDRARPRGQLTHSDRSGITEPSE
jgi:UDP-N-acetylglucosamine 2-epimerase (non-hydrolysing)